MLWQLEAATGLIVAQSLMGTFFAAKGQRVTLPTQPMVPHGGGCQLSDRRQKQGHRSDRSRGLIWCYEQNRADEFFRL